MQDHKTVFVQKSTSQVSWIYLEFGEIGNLAALTKRWGRSFPARPSKISISIEWCGWALRCIVFGVVVVLGTPRISDPTAFVASRMTIFAGLLRVGCVWRLGPALHPPKRCANAMNCASRLLLNVWLHAGSGLTNMAWPGLTYFIAKIPLMTIMAHAQSWTPSFAWKGNIDFHRFPGSPASRLVDNQSWNKKCAGLEHQSDFVETREIYNYIYSYVIANIWIIIHFVS